MTTQAPPSSSTPMDAEPELPQCLECLSDQLTLTDLLRECYVIVSRKIFNPNYL